MDKESSVKIYGLIGWPVKHSLSKKMQEAAFNFYKMPAEYRLIPVNPEELQDFLLHDKEVVDAEGQTISIGDLSGFNITIPHKVKAREILEREFPYDKDAPMMEDILHYVKLLGAINTVKRKGSKLEYRNTDAAGFLESLEKDLKFNSRDKNILLFGCGGAGRAVIAALSWKQNKIKKIYTTDINDTAIDSARDYFSQFPRINEKLEFIPNENIPKVIGNCGLLVNATPCGMEETDPCVVDEKLIHRNLAVFDLIYNPKETKLLKIAREKGAAATNGLGMLLYQGARAFEFWTGEKAPVTEMWEALNQGVKNL